MSKVVLAAGKRIRGRTELYLNWDHIGTQYRPPEELDLEAMPNQYRRAHQSTPGQHKNKSRTPQRIQPHTTKPDNKTNR